MWSEAERKFMSACTLVHWYTLHFYTGTVLHFFTVTELNWYTGTLLHCYTDIRVTVTCLYYMAEPSPWIERDRELKF